MPCNTASRLSSQAEKSRDCRCVPSSSNVRRSGNNVTSTGQILVRPNTKLWPVQLEDGSKRLQCLQRQLARGPSLLALADACMYLERASTSVYAEHSPAGIKAEFSAKKKSVDPIEHDTITPTTVPLHRSTLRSRLPYSQLFRFLTSGPGFSINPWICLRHLLLTDYVRSIPSP